MCSVRPWSGCVADRMAPLRRRRVIHCTGYTTLDDLRNSGMTFQDDDARDLGLAKLRQRKRFLAAHKELQTQVADPSPALTEVTSVPSPRSPPTVTVHTHTPIPDHGTSRTAGSGGGRSPPARGQLGRGRGRAATLPAWHTNAAKSGGRKLLAAAGGGGGEDSVARTGGAMGGKRYGGSWATPSEVGGQGWGSAAEAALKSSATTSQESAVGWGVQPAKSGGGGWGSAAEAALKSSATTSQESAVGRGALANPPRPVMPGPSRSLASSDAGSAPVRGGAGRGRGRAATLPAWQTKNAAGPVGGKRLSVGRGDSGTGGVPLSWGGPAPLEGGSSRSTGAVPTTAGYGWGSDATSTQERVARGGRALSTGSSNDFLPGDWECEKCGFHNFASRTVCRRCEASFPSATTGVEISNDESTSDYTRTRKRSATDVIAVTVDLTVDDDPVFPAQLVPACGTSSATRKPGSIVAERRAKRLAREAAAAKAAAASESSVSTVDPGRDPRRRLGGGSSIATGSGASPRGTPSNELLEKLDREKPCDE